MKRLLILLLLAVFFSLGAAFSYFNPDPVTVDYLAGSVELKLGLVLIAVFGATLVVTLAAFWMWSVAQRAEIRRLRRKLQNAEAELSNLRNLPLEQH